MKRASMLWRPIALLVFVTMSSQGYSAEATPSSQIRSGGFGNIFDSVELNPILRADGGPLAWPIGLAVSGEIVLKDRIFWHAGIAHHQLGRREILQADGFQLRGVSFSRQHVMSNGIFGGLRYYDDPYGNSWYGGLRIGFERLDASYSFDQSDVTEVSHYMPLTLQIGFRAVLDERISARAGISIPENYLLSQQIKNRSKSEEEESQQLGAIQFRNLSVIDFAVSYHL